MRTLKVSLITFAIVAAFFGLLANPEVAVMLAAVVVAVLSVALIYSLVDRLVP